jgi:hypothetical protein
MRYQERFLESVPWKRNCLYFDSTYYSIENLKNQQTCVILSMCTSRLSAVFFSKQCTIILKLCNDGAGGWNPRQRHFFLDKIALIWCRSLPAVGVSCRSNRCNEKGFPIVAWLCSGRYLVFTKNIEITVAFAWNSVSFDTKLLADENVIFKFFVISSLRKIWKQWCSFGW